MFKKCEMKSIEKRYILGYKRRLIKTHKMGTKYTNHLVKMEYGYVKITILPKYGSEDWRLV